MKRSIYLIDYQRHANPKQAFAEWLAWVEAMAIFDNGIYD